jgi:hypothetical protein
MTGRVGPDRLTVLYIGGLGRSGSTLLDLMLGQVPGFCAVGELSYIWARDDDDLCGCGRPFGRCPFWVQVGVEAFGGWDKVDRGEIVGLRAAVDRNRHIARLWRRASPDQARYGELLVALYRGVAAASGASVIVDSTKHLSTAVLLRGLPDIDLRIVHLIRDSRGVAFSWTKRVARTWIAGGDAQMDRYPPVRTALRWLWYNLGFQVLGALGTPRIRMRYEDLVVRPLEESARAVGLAGHPWAGAPFIEGSRLDLAEAHTIGGNPVRFAGSSLELKLDETWRRDLGRGYRAVVTSVTLPLLAAYGYLFRKRADD